MAVVLAGCAAGESKPYAIIDGTKTRGVDVDTYEVLVFAVDGQLYPRGKREQRLTPGFHYLELVTTKRDKTGLVSRLPFAISAKPCVRYYVVAKHEKTLSDVRWRPVVIDEEPIAGCVAP
jgi:hypothetical protein